MSLGQPTDLEKAISAENAEQLRNALSTIVGAELADRDLDEDTDPELVHVTLGELARSCPVPEEKIRMLMERFAGEPGTGIEKDGNRFEIDPRR